MKMDDLFCEIKTKQTKQFMNMCQMKKKKIK